MSNHPVFIIVDFRPLSLTTDTGVTTRTSSGYPYIDLIHPQLGVAIGGNGSAAKACDVFGGMAARMLLKGQWDDDLPHEWFKFVRHEDGDESKAKLLYAKL